MSDRNDSAAMPSGLRGLWHDGLSGISVAPLFTEPQTTKPFVREDDRKYIVGAVPLYNWWVSGPMMMRVPPSRRRAWCAYVLKHFGQLCKRRPPNPKDILRTVDLTEYTIASVVAAMEEAKPIPKSDRSILSDTRRTLYMLERDCNCERNIHWRIALNARMYCTVRHFWPHSAVFMRGEGSPAVFTVGSGIVVGVVMPLFWDRVRYSALENASIAHYDDVVAAQNGDEERKEGC